jgi:acetyl esterase
MKGDNEKNPRLRTTIAILLLVAASIGFDAPSLPSNALQASERHILFDVTAKLDDHYDTNDADALLDVYYPSYVSETGRLPTIVWLHGGSFIGGSKEGIAHYLVALAARNFTVVGVNYSLAPARKYPTPFVQVNTALGFLSKHAAELHVDESKLFLAGDSAGAHIAAQAAIVVSNSTYAQRIGIASSINRRQLRGVILYCGVYDLHTLSSDLVLTYIGTDDPNDPRLEESSVVRNVRADFPAMFISVGNRDALAPQSYVLAEIANKLGIMVDALFFPNDHTPPLPHEYQFDLKTEAGQLALERTAKFIADPRH